MLDEILQSGSNFKDAVIRALRRLDNELTQLRPISGRGIRLRRTAAGTVIEADGHVQTFCNTPPAAAPAAGSGYTGPFAVSYDDANGTVSVYDSYHGLSGTAGYVSACGQTLTVHRTTINAAVADELFVCLVLYVANDALAYEIIVTREWSDRTQREYIPLAALLPPPSGGTVTVIQYQHGHIRAGFGRVW